VGASVIILMYSTRGSVHKRQTMQLLSFLEKYCQGVQVLCKAHLDTLHTNQLFSVLYILVISSAWNYIVE
jgi:hypothetical protein